MNKAAGNSGSLIGFKEIPKPKLGTIQKNEVYMLIFQTYKS